METINIMKSTEQNFKVSKCGKYFRTKILRFKPGNISIDVNMSTSQLHTNRTEAEKYMKLILDMEVAVKKELESQGLNYDPMKLIVHSIQIICSWSEGFDIRHTLSIEDQAKLVVLWYDNAYKKAKERCVETLSGLKEKPVPYIGNYRAHDKYNHDNKIFELEMEELDQYYKEDPLDVMLAKSKEMLDMLIKKNNDEI